MTTYSINEIRSHLAAALTEAQNGHEAVITRYGKPVAKLVPYNSEPLQFPDLTEFRQSIKASGKPLSEIVSAERNEK